MAAVLVAAMAAACARSSEEERTARSTGREGAAKPAAGEAAPDAAAGSTSLPGTGRRIPPLTKGEGTRRMGELLQSLNRAAKPGVNPFLNAERAAQIRDTMPRMADPLDRMLARTQMADELLRAGRVREAIRTVEPLLTPTSAEARYAPPPVQTLEFLGLASLRLGETDNCIRDHSAESCLLPIRGGGVHRRPEGSQRALELFGQVLRERPGDLSTRWLYNLAAMTLGLYPDKVEAGLRIPPETFASEADIGRFPDVAPAAGVSVRQHAGGAIMDDFDGDGPLDLVLSSMGLGDPLRFFHNNGDGTFAERTDAAGLKPLVGGLNVIHADYDNDGDNDLLVLRGGWMHKGGNYPDSLLRNNGDGTFDDVTEEAGLLAFHPSQTGAFADYDGDGWLDLAIGQADAPDEPHPTALYRNNGDGTFADRSADLGPDTRFGYVKAVVWGDYDNDGRPDLFCSVLSGGNRLFRNAGPPEGAAAGAAGWRFTDVTRPAGLADKKDSFPSWFWDFDNDGWLDLLVAGFKFVDMNDIVAFHLGQPTQTAFPSLFRNNHDGTFTDVAHATRIDRIALAMGSNYGDLDNDGWPDCYFGDGEPGFRSLIPNRMFRNDGGRRFQDITHSAGTGHIQKGHGVAMGDLDNDGDLDVFEEMGGWYQDDQAHSALYRNPGHPEHHWVTLRLEGSRTSGASSADRATNRSAIGARIRVRVQDAKGERDVHAIVGTGGSFGGNSLQAEIGLGAARAIREIEVVWPTTGRKDTLRDVTMDRFYHLVEGTGRLEPVTRKKIPL